MFALGDRNTLVNFPNSYNRSVKVSRAAVQHFKSNIADTSHMFSVAVVTQARQLAMTDDGHLLFHPSGSVLQMFRVEDGKPFKVLRGHMETINSCAWNPDMQVRSEALLL